MTKTILSLCDYTGNWPKYYKEAGYEVILIDIKYGQDVRLFIPPKDIYGVLAAPPCTCFANSGARWKRTDAQMIDALSIVDACVRIATVCNPKFWALENPIGKLKRYLGPPQLYFDPCDYGDPYTKKTCLWGDFIIPPKKRVEPIKVCQQGSWVQKLGGKSDRTKELRSATPLGFAKAFFEANP